jgi:peptidoglycan/LPS O-acetylase OafA/YrhL
MVLFYHLLWSSTTTGSRLMDIIVGIRTAGWVGVDLFFALSGFLITGILFDTLHTRNYFKNFYARRILRIFPLYYGVIVLLLVFFHPLHFGQGRQLYLLPAYLQNTSLWWNGSQSIGIKDQTGHLWSLAVEEQFYLVWPVLIFLIRDRRKLLWTAVALAAMAPIARLLLLNHGATFEATYKLTFCRADSLLAGAWLALILRGGLRETVLGYAAPVFWVAVFLCGVVAWRTGSFDWEASRSINLYGYSLIALACTALIAMALRPLSLIAKAMANRPLRWLGKYSYGIYIYHQIVGFPVGFAFAGFLHAHLHSKSLFHLASMASIVGITLPLSVLSFHFYEQPFLRLKRHFSNVSADLIN